MGAQRLRKPTRAGEQFLRPLRHLGLLQVLEKLGRSFALGFADRFDDASLRHTAEIVINSWRPARSHNVEANGFGDAVGVGKRTRPPIPGFKDRVDAKRKAVSASQSSAASRGNCSDHRRCRSSTALAMTVSLRPGAWLPKTTLFTSISRQDSGV